ncbi:MAG: DsbA family oxidoreductase [Thermomicrobiales bacterium]|nr:DsbA family oxidoreductase [Thermomicrobiales bacterium]
MNVQVVSDVVCPWCRIGKKNLRAAADRFTQETGEEVNITFLPFLLDPIKPEEEGESFRDRFVKRKGLSEEQMQQMFQRVTEVGASFGLNFDFGKVELAVNTVPAHELMELAPADKREALMDALMTAYFEQGQNVGNVDVLLAIARTVLGEAETNAIEQPLRNHRERENVLGMIGQVQQSGISGVPFTIVDGKFAVSGGQPPQAFYETLLKAQGVNQEIAARQG